MAGTSRAFPSPACRPRPLELFRGGPRRGARRDWGRPFGGNMSLSQNNSWNRRLGNKSLSKSATPGRD